MYHMGCPWDIYKPKTSNYRVPAGEGSLWCYQWTTRDIINTSYFRPTVGSTTFSTDADDINFNGIPRFQSDYYSRMLAEYRKNLSHHDVNVFLVHQEDHDSHIHTSNRVLENFVDQVHEMDTFATLDEVTAWLNRRFAPEEHPYQVIEMNDPLTCHAQMKHLSSMGDIPKRFSENASWGTDGKPNPAHVAYYGTDYMFLIEKGALAPKILYDYTKSDEYAFAEDGEYPEERVPEITSADIHVTGNADEMKIEISFTSEGDLAALPVAYWNGRNERLPRGAPAGYRRGGKAVPGLAHEERSRGSGQECQGGPEHGDDHVQAEVSAAVRGRTTRESMGGSPTEKPGSLCH